MAGMVLPIISSATRSPWFKATRDICTAYGDHEGRLTPVDFGRPAIDEYRVMRTTAGIFDVPERPLEIRGPDAPRFLDRMFTRRVGTMQVGRGRYGLACNHQGGLACDGVVFRLAEDWFWYVHADRDMFSWMQALSEGFDVTIRDPQAWAIQIQGPRALDILGPCCDGAAPEGFKYYHARQVTMGGQPVLISRTGWTGELGFEVYNMDSAVDGLALWQHLIDAGKSFGMEALSTYAMNPRRLEAGIMNYGTDMNWETTPFDLGLGAFVDFDGADFVGKKALRQADRRPRFTGFTCTDGDLKWNSTVMLGGESVGRVKAFDHSPQLETGIGFVLFDKPEHMLAEGFTVVDRAGKARSITLHSLPFYDAEKRIPRGLEVSEFQ